MAEQEAVPYGGALVVAIGAAVAVPMVVGVGAIQQAVGSATLVVAPILLLVLIRFLASEHSATLSRAIASATTQPDSIHRIGGSSFGVALILLLLVLFLLLSHSLRNAGEASAAA